MAPSDIASCSCCSTSCDLVSRHGATLCHDPNTSTTPAERYTDKLIQSGNLMNFDQSQNSNLNTSLERPSQELLNAYFSFEIGHSKQKLWPLKDSYQNSSLFQKKYFHAPTILTSIFSSRSCLRPLATRTCWHGNRIGIQGVEDETL